MFAFVVPAPESKTSAVVDSVARLCELQDIRSHEQLKVILQDEDAASVVRKLKVYNEFFPVFHDIMKQLMQMLGK